MTIYTTYKAGQPPAGAPATSGGHAGGGAGGLFSGSPYDTPIPNVAQYGKAGLLAKTAYQNALAKINRNRSQLIRQYGYSGDVDPNTGVMTNLRVDPHNPYGNLQAMYRNHAVQAEQAQFAAQERGLHGGLANKAASDLAYQRGMESSQLGTQLTDAFADLQEQQTGAKFDFDKALYEAELEAARQAIANGNFNPSGGGGDDGSGDDGNGDGGGGNGSCNAQCQAAKRYASWLAGQAAGAGMYRTNSPRGIHGTYVN